MSTLGRAQRVRSVLVTGASTGIGRAIALGLDARGYRVFAGVRRDADGATLEAVASNRLRPVMLDVTDAASLRAARTEIDRALGSAGLDGLVNNAGVAIAGPLEFIALDALRLQFEVNVFGLVAVIQEFAGAVRQVRGRIVNIGSMGGFIAPALQGPYCASKFAIEGLTDSLRRELEPFGVHVSLIEPGSIDTRIWHKASEDGRRVLEQLPEHARELYGAAGERALSWARKAAARAVSPDVVSALVLHALESKHPRTRYLAGLDAKLAKAATWALPDRAVDWILRKVG